MDNLHIEPTKSSPRVSFDCHRHVLEIVGESYPEDAHLFYRPVFDWLNDYLAQLGEETVQVKVDVSYFNSSCSKVFMDLFELLDDQVQNGKSIEVYWISHEENDMGIECGEEFKECVVALPIHITIRS